MVECPCPTTSRWAVGPAREPVLPRRDDLRRGLGLGLGVAESEAIIGRYFERGGNFIDTANGYTGGHSERDHRRLHRATTGAPRRVVIATKFFSNLSPAIPTAAAPAARRSSRRASSRCAGCGPTTSTSTGCTCGIASRRSKRRCARWTIWCAPARCATSASRTRRRGRWRRRRRWRTSAAGRRWSALQIEYSLLERTVEGELVPMALELGLGITPWSPLRAACCAASTRGQTPATASPDRGARVQSLLTERKFTILDEVKRVAGELGHTRQRWRWPGCRRGRAWPRRSSVRGGSISSSEPGGARHRAARRRQVAALDEVSEPALNFPAAFFRIIPTFAQGGTTMNGTPSAAWPMMPRTDAERY